MLKAKDIMTKDIITVAPDTEIVAAARLVLEKRVNGIPVVDETGKLVGIICQSDLIAQQKAFPVPSLFTLLDGFIPLTSMNEFRPSKAHSAIKPMRMARMGVGGKSAARRRRNTKAGPKRPTNAPRNVPVQRAHSES